MIIDHVIKRGMTLPSFPVTFSGGSGRSLAGATVTFDMAEFSGAVKVASPAVIEDAPLRKVRYDFTSSDTDDAGTVVGGHKDFRACWFVTYGDGKTERFPAQGYQIVRVEYALT